jgi:hypothetical protein
MPLKNFSPWASGELPMVPQQHPNQLLDKMKGQVAERPRSEGCSWEEETHQGGEEGHGAEADSEAAAGWREERDKRDVR